MSATKLTTKAVLTTPATDDIAMVVDVSDTTGSAEGTSKQITLANLKSAVSAVTEVNGAVGVVSLDVNDLDDVISLSPTQGDVLQWNSGISKWIESSQLTTLWAEFRNGTSVNVYADGSTVTQGRLELTATGANVKTGVTGMTVTETSPGDIEFTVATGSTGQTTHSAVLIDGTTTGSQTDFLLKAGTKLKISDGTYYTWLKASGNAADTTLTLPVGNGTLALTSDIPSAGIAAVVDDTSPQLGGNLDVNGFTITSTANADIDIEPNGTGDINLKADTLNLTDNSNSARFEIAAGYVRLISTVGTIWQANSGVNRFDVKQPLALGDASPGSSQKLAIRAGNSQTYIVFESSANVEVGNFKNDASGNISFTLNGDITTTETLDAVNIKVNGAQGTNGQVLTSTGSGVGWSAVPSSGTVTSVAMSVPSAFAISGSPITTSGTLALSVGGTAAQYIDGTGALQTLPQGVTSVSGTAPIVVTGSNTPTVSITAATTSAAGSMSAADKTTLNSLASAYEETELVTGQNTLMLTSVSVASNKIVDIMGDALADTSNANSKKFIGFHTGNGDCVLQGMVDAVSAISGATAGGPLWIGASGVFSSAAPTTANYYSRVVGYFVGTGQGGEIICYFDPSKDWVQIS